MTRRDDYRSQLQQMERAEWVDYLIAHSALPGPRANLELAQAAADLIDESQCTAWLDLDPDLAPDDSPRLFLPLCGAIGLGRLVTEGRADLLGRLRTLADDPRWRVREAVVLGLQRLGDGDPSVLVSHLRDWSEGSFLEQRAAVAALSEPRLLRDAAIARELLAMLDRVTRSIEAASDRRAADLRVLRQSLGYCWSVAVAALPAEGKPALERWAASPDPDVRWIVRENLKKSRLQRMDAAWVDALRARIS